MPCEGHASRILRLWSGPWEEGVKLVMFPWMSQCGDIWSSSSVGELAANSVDEVCWEANS